MSKDTLTRDLKRLYTKAGVKCTVQRGKGTAWNWIDIISSNGLFSDEEIERAHSKGLSLFRSNVHAVTRDEARSLIGGSSNKAILNSSKYRKLKTKLVTLSRKYDSIGTCVGGSGAYVQKNGTKIDFIKNPNQSEQGIWKAEKELSSEFAKLGLTLDHEGGWMD